MQYFDVSKHKKTTFVPSFKSRENLNFFKIVKVHTMQILELWITLCWVYVMAELQCGFCC